MTIRGYLRNTRTRPDVRRLTLYFDKKHRSAIPLGKKEPIVLELGSGPSWRGTMNSTSPNNHPYVHDSLARAGTRECSCTEVFESLGLAEQAELEFDLSGNNYFRLVRVASRGTNKEGNSLHRSPIAVGSLVTT